MPLRAKQQLLENWRRLYPTRDYYTGPLDTTPLPFTHLHKLIATRIHQFRSGNSYLRGQQSWINLGHSITCKRCGLEDETPHHAILTCKAREHLRPPPLANTESLDEVWNNYTLTLHIASYISATRTGFPVTRSPSPLHSNLGSLSTLTTQSSSQSSTPVLGPIPSIYAS